MDDPSAGDRVRLIDVARRCGVTKSVVSRVLNDDPSLNVRPETRQRIRAAALELGYRAHAGARALAGAETRALALLIPDLANPVYSRIIRGAYRRAREHGYVVLLAEDTADDGADEAFADLVEAGRVDGLLIASARPGHRLLSSARLARIPHVFVNREVPGSGRNVAMELAAASATAVRYLHGMGHRRIAMVSGPADLQPARLRERGFVDAVRALGLPSELVARGEFSEQGGASAAGRLLDREPGPTAVYCSTLGQAVGALHAIRTRGLHVPADVSVVTYDDLPLAGYLDPPLTSVAMPLLELGAAAVDAVLQQLAGGPAADVAIRVPPAIVERGSVRRLP
ncbi:LacI family DNA-binding transcriptional regulator [Pseudonocardia cypriaca]|uniref:LacI family transcriptional regulator n=1 Tax=Pseudonocardia cypriaca TaxID=882449 RepID=A0A543FPE7_9PSEU|nr:LacI family DNA-binding transcriptional regulator [Pseudonocardia cypriaca]TQM35725.1 LacI family transcriptional regulator [Pseudonocardia cypriaca]